jgi:hypothetical protein
MCGTITNVQQQRPQSPVQCTLRQHQADQAQSLQPTTSTCVIPTPAAALGLLLHSQPTATCVP